jgi:hypothetical protein
MVADGTCPDDSWREGLVAHPGWRCDVYSSAGVAADRVQALASASDAAWRYIAEALGSETEAALLILDEHDWPSRSTHPVYGMPNADTGRLMMAATPNRFWADFIALIRQQAPDHVPAMKAAYGTNRGDLDLGRFFDLVATHELVHLFFENPVRLPCFWVEELTCNLLLHGYVAERQPSALPALTTFPAAFISIEPPTTWYRSLADFEVHYAYDMDPFNYGWYQCRLHLAAAAIYDRSGTGAARSLRDACATPATAGRIKDLSQSELLALLDDAAPAFADLARHW